MNMIDFSYYAAETLTELEYDEKIKAEFKATNLRGSSLSSPQTSNANSVSCMVRPPANPLVTEDTSKTKASGEIHIKWDGIDNTNATQTGGYPILSYEVYWD